MIQFFSPFEQRLKAQQPGVVLVCSHARRIDIDKAPHVGQFIATLEKFVHLFLVLDKDIGGLYAVDPTGQFLGHGGGEEGYRHRTHGLGT